MNEDINNNNIASGSTPHLVILRNPNSNTSNNMGSNNNTWSPSTPSSSVLSTPQSPQTGATTEEPAAKKRKVFIKLGGGASLRSATPDPPTPGYYADSHEDISMSASGINIAQMELREEFEDYSDLPLKSDHVTRPLWITPDNRIFLESFSPEYPKAHALLVTVAEPVSRPSYIHEYCLTPFSLFAAASLELTTQGIIEGLEMFSKTPIPESAKQFIISCTQSFGQVKLVLKDNRYWLETGNLKILRKLLKDETLSSLRDTSDTNYDIAALDAEEIHEEDDKIHAFKLSTSVTDLEPIKTACADLGYPVVEEYDFEKDRRNPELKMDLKPTTMIRHYQEKSLNKMFGGG